MDKFPLYAQADTRWKDVKLGTSQETLGEYGCLVSSFATMFSYSENREVNPVEMNAEFVKHGKFFYNGAYLNVQNAAEGVLGGRVKWLENSPTFPGPVPASWMGKLRDHLAIDEFNFAIIMLDMFTFTPKLDSHFVCAYGVNAAGAILCCDPAFAVKGTLGAGVGNTYYSAVKTRDYYGKTDETRVWRFDMFTAKRA